MCVGFTLWAWFVADLVKVFHPFSRFCKGLLSLPCRRSGEEFIEPLRSRAGDGPILSRGADPLRPPVADAELAAARLFAFASPEAACVRFLDAASCCSISATVPLIWKFNRRATDLSAPLIATPHGHRCDRWVRQPQAVLQTATTHVEGHAVTPAEQGWTVWLFSLPEQPSLRAQNSSGSEAPRSRTRGWP